MSATITTTARVHTAKSFIESLSDSYFFAGKIDSWDDEDSPDLPTGTDDINSTKSSILFVKKIQPVDISACMLGIKRFDWQTGRVYTPWQSDVDMYFVRNWLSAIQPYYVLVIDGTDYNVYMCIDNADGALSISKPSGQLTNSFTTADGYIWKFMYNIKEEYVPLINGIFLPCPLYDAQKSDVQLLAESSVKKGTIDKIRILEDGSGYNSTSTIVISGDGTGAAASFTYDGDGKITSVTMTNTGQDYSYASVVITSPGSGASFKAILSPLNGHGADVQTELCACTALIKPAFIHTENDYFLTKNSYRRVGIIKDIKDTDGDVLTDDRYNYLHEIQVQNITGIFSFSQKIIGTSSGASAILYDIDPQGSPTASFHVLDKKKDFVVGETVYQESDPSKIAVVTSVINNSIDVLSGDLLYVDNIQYITRKAGQTETFLIYIDF